MTEAGLYSLLKDATAMKKRKMASFSATAADRRITTMSHPHVCIMSATSEISACSPMTQLASITLPQPIQFGKVLTGSSPMTGSASGMAGWINGGR